MAQWDRLSHAADLDAGFAVQMQASEGNSNGSEACNEAFGNSGDISKEHVILLHEWWLTQRF